MPKIEFILDKFPDKVYSKDPDGNLYKILSSMSKEFDDFIEDMADIKKAHFVDEASGENLEKICAILNVRRFFGESDQSLRGRIKTIIPSFIGGGAIESIKHVVKEYLGVNPVVIEHYRPGNGHALFHDGVLNGFTSIQTSGLNLQVKEGTAYISGARITSNDTNITIPISSTRYIKLNSNGTISSQSNNTLTSSQILLSQVITNATTITSVVDQRTILDPYQHYITNTATITIQIPYSFTESLITLNDVKNVLIKTRAAGIALLINVVGAYGDNLTITDFADTSFLVGYSGIGAANYFGGQ